MGKYTEVITELAISGTLTYSIPKDMQVVVGARVVITVSRRRYIGVVSKIHDVKPNYRVLPIKEVIDPQKPLINELEIDLWHWVAQYYMCGVSAVYRFAVPNRIRKNTFVPNNTQMVKLATKENLTNVLDSLHRAPKQTEIMTRFLELSDYGKNPVERETLLKNLNTTPLTELYNKQILEQYEEESLLPSFEQKKSIAEVLKSEIIREIEEQFQQKETVLLYEQQLTEKLDLYIYFIETMAAQNRQTLILMPDGYAAQHLYEQLSSHYAKGIIAYHQNIPESQRAQLFKHAFSEAAVVVGARGAVFLPMERLGMVIIDQEHDYSYKHTESVPRLNIRDVALVKAQKYGAKVLLCSETPAVESYFNATRSLWGLVKTAKNDDTHCSFMVLERGKELLSKYLRQRIAETISENRQVLIFQNRRGFSQWIECQQCHYIPTCPDCNVLLTYHKKDNSLQCHYCGYRESYTGSCKECGNSQMQFQGRGTERIENSLQTLFPDAVIQRIDYDSTRGKDAFNEIESSIATDCNIIVGTQMVVRGVNFSKIGLIGIVNADNILSHSDFRTSEKAHSLIKLLSNRIQKGGEVIIQTSHRLNDVIDSVKEQKNSEFYENLIDERFRHNYPPAVRMIKIHIAHNNSHILMDSALRLEQILRHNFGNRISPPFEPDINRIQGEYLLEFYLRIERTRSTVYAKELVDSAIKAIKQYNSSISIHTDVDPL